MAKNRKVISRRTTEASKAVPLQVMVPVAVKKQVGMLCADRGENIRTVVLRGLRAVGVQISDDELTEHRGRKRVG